MSGGTIQGKPQRVANAFNNFRTGTIGVAFPAVPIYQQQLPCLEVIVQNDPSSANNVTVGNAGDGQYLVLVPGVSITIPINDVNKIRAGTAGGAATVNWIAMV